MHSYNTLLQYTPCYNALEIGPLGGGIMAGCTWVLLVGYIGSTVYVTLWPSIFVS